MKTKKNAFSMVEMMISISVIGIFFLGVTNVYQNLTVGIVNSRMRTVATNLAQEKIEYLKDISYYRLRVTSLNDSVNYGYDNTYYVPETGIKVGDTLYERRVLIQRVQEDEDGNLIEVLPEAGNTELKKITVTVVWYEKNVEKTFSLSNMRDNPSRNPLNGSISGTIYDQDTYTGLSEVRVVVVDNLNWYDITDSNGDYSIAVPTGTYQIRASKDEYWTKTSDTLNVAEEETGCDLYLSEMAQGTINGYVFYNDHLLISQVVGSTPTAEGVEQEYIELYNPTTFYIQMTDSLGTPLIELYYQKESELISEISLTYDVVGASVSPHSYFLIANTSTVSVFGVLKEADAVYNPEGEDIIKTPNRGCIGLRRASDSSWIDRVGWQKDGFNPEFYEAQAINQIAGFTVAEQYVRRTDQSGVSSGYGRAYDSGNNETDFIDTTSMIYPVKNSSDTEEPISGVPAFGAVVSCNDGVSSPVVAVSAGTPPYAQFQLTNVATGTWTTAIFFSTTNYTAYHEIGDVTLINDGGTVSIPNSTTNPEWPAINTYNTVMTSVPAVGVISGFVYSGGSGVSGIKVTAGLQYAYTSTNGYYTLKIEPGAYIVTANPDNLDCNYTSQQSTDTIGVEMGKITSGIDFDISSGGSISGSVLSDASDPLPNILVMAYDFNDNEVTSVLTESDGSFIISNLSTNVNNYTIMPILDSGESCSPVSRTVTVVAGITETDDVDGNENTFSVSSAYGTIVGTVKADDVNINTGVLIIATDTTIADDPPDFDTTIRSGSDLYYGTCSKSDGTYEFQVRGNQSYNLYAWYVAMESDGSPIITRRTGSTTVYPGNHQTVDFSW
ncbi:MAG: carboxypeptidase regulatory-like domain-containing protein [Endomicrobiales bacterium]|nr:carboxypeptidase regulatory-like domain-containing protein [Endomicrobiales bacterium]